MIDLRNCDCLEYMRGLSDNAFDLAIVDPPYGINAPNMNMGSAPNRKEAGQYSGVSTAVKIRTKGRLNSGGGKLKNRKLNTSLISWDNEKPGKEYFDELRRVSKNQIIWGGNYFADMLPASRCCIVWNKNQPWDNFSQAELAWTSFDKPTKLFTYSNRGGANEKKKIHPTEKSVFLYKYCLEHFAAEGDTIFDSHGGSGNICLACDEYGYDLTICEINEEIFKDMSKNYNDYKKQIKLF